MKIRNLFQIFLAVMMMAMFTSATEVLAQSYTLGGNYVKFQKFVQPNPEEAAQYVVTTEAEEGEEVTASIDPDKIPQGKYFTGVYTSQDVTLTTDWDGATFTMPAKDVTVNAELAAQEDYTIDLTSSTSEVIPMEISTLLSYMEVGGHTCSVYDKDYNWFLDLNVDGTPDLEVKSTFDQTIQDQIFSIEVLSGSGVYKTSCSFALNVTPPDRYKSLTFKFKEVVPVRTLQAGWITLSGDSFTYDGTEHKPAVTVVDGNTSVAVTVEYSKNKDAGEATVTVVANAENYTGSVIKTFTIKPMPVTISGVKANDKVYDGNARAVIDISGATIDGKVEGDELTVNAESVTAAFADANAGGGKAVILSGNFTLAGTSAGNYTLSVQPDIAAGTIAPKEVKVSGLSAEEKNYDPHNNVATINCRGAVFNGLIEGDELTISDVTGTYIIGENVDATLDVTLDYTNATLGGKSAANYKLATEDNQATTIITIHKVSQTVTITFDPNGGTGEMDPMSAQKGETVRLTDNTFYRQGYSFKNWNTKADGSGDKYEDKQSIKIDEDLTLYAQWKEKNIIETNIETKKNLDGSTTTIVTSKETDSSGKLVKESNTSTTQYPDGSKKILESKTPETDNAGRSINIGDGDDRGWLRWKDSRYAKGAELLIPQGSETNVLVNTTTEKNAQGEVTATSASLTVKQTGDTEGATGKSKPTQIAINAGGGVNTNAPTSGKCGGYMTWVVSANAGSSVYDVLTISGSGKMEDGSPWDAYQNQIKTVIIGEGVTRIGNGAFQYCSSLTSVTIPAGVTSIGEFAFSDCSSLTSVTIPAGVTRIGGMAFSYCSAMTSLTFAEGSQLQTIGDYAFYGLTSLTSDIILPASVTSIGQDAFASVPENTTDGIHVYITVPDGKKLKVTIAGVTDPVEITPTNGKADIIGCLFDDPSIRIASRALTLALTDASTGGEGGGDNGGGSENPDAPTSGTFGNLTWEVSKSDANSTVYDVLTISGSGKMNNGSPWDAYQNQIKTVIIGEGVTSIGNFAFYGCSSLKSVTIPAGVTSIGIRAFNGCSSLKSVTIPASVKSIGNLAFNGCSSLTSVTIPAGVTSIGIRAFNGCSAMTSLTFAEGSQLQTIGYSAFYGLISLASDITLPAGVTSIGNSAFSSANASIDLSNCTQLKAIGSDMVFSQVTGDVTLPSSVTSICQYAFENERSQPYPGNHVYITVPDGKKLKVTIAGVTDPVEVTHTNGKADIIGCLFDDPRRIASRALTLKIVDPSTGDDNGGGSASGQGQEPSTREKNDRAAKTMIVNYEKEKTGSAGGNSSVVSSPEEVNSTAATAGSLEGEGGAGADPDLVKGDHNTGGTTAGSRAATAEEEDDEIEIVSGREYEILHDGFIVLNFYTAGGSITVNSIIIRSPGDANNDGYVNAADIVEMINAKDDKASKRFNLTNADIDRDGTITQRDIDFVVKYIMEPKDKGDE